VAHFVTVAIPSSPLTAKQRLLLKGSCQQGTCTGWEACLGSKELLQIRRTEQRLVNASHLSTVPSKHPHPSDVSQDQTRTRLRCKTQLTSQTTVKGGYRKSESCPRLAAVRLASSLAPGCKDSRTAGGCSVLAFLVSSLFPAG
jgi:hypothetical protein